MIVVIYCIEISEAVDMVQDRDMDVVEAQTLTDSAVVAITIFGMWIGISYVLRKI